MQCRQNEVTNDRRRADRNQCVLQSANASENQCNQDLIKNCGSEFLSWQCKCEGQSQQQTNAEPQYRNVRVWKRNKRDEKHYNQASIAGQLKLRANRPD